MLTDKTLRCRSARGVPVSTRPLVPQLYATENPEERNAILGRMVDELQRDADHHDRLAAIARLDETPDKASIDAAVQVAAVRRAEAGMLALWADVERSDATKRSARWSS